MKVGIISDSHDHITELHAAIQACKEQGCKRILHCGDFCAPFMILEMDKEDIQIDCVFGNVDDRHLSTKKAAETKNVTLHGDVAMLHIDGKHIVMNHFPHIAKAFAMSEQFDVVLYGHTHKKHLETFDATLLANPGELMGRLGEKTYAIYDTKAHTITHYTL